MRLGMEQKITLTKRESPRVARLAVVAKTAVPKTVAPNTVAPKGLRHTLALLIFLASLAQTNPAAAEGTHRIKRTSTSPKLFLVNSSSTADNAADTLGLAKYPEKSEAGHPRQSTDDINSLPPSSRQSFINPLKGAALNMGLEHAELAKRNNLESLAIKPWTPGRGSLGVKVEVTW